MKLYKSTDEIPVDHPTIVVYSSPGEGKTTLGYGAEEPLMMDNDLGAHRAKNRKDTMQPDSWKDMEEIVDGKLDPQLKSAFGKTFSDYKTVVVDTAGRALDSLTLDIIERNSKHGAAGSLSQQGWGQLKTRFAAFKNTLTAQKKNIVFLCHGKEDKDGESRIWRPDVQGGSLGELLKSADLIAFLRIVGKDRILEWSPSERWIAKSPGWPTMKVPSWESDPYFLSKIQQKAREDLGKMDQEAKKAAETISALLGKVEEASVEDLNMMLTNKDEFPAYVRAQVKPHIIKRAEVLGATVDKKAGVYVAKAEAVA